MSKLGDSIIKNNAKAVWIYAVTSLFLKCLYFQFSTGINRINEPGAADISMVLANLAGIVILASVISLLPFKRSGAVMLTYDIFYSALLFTDLNYFRYYYSAVTVDAFRQFDVKVLPAVNGSILMLIKPLDFILLIDLPVLLGLIAFTVIRFRREPRVRVREYWKKPVALIAAGILVLTASATLFRLGSVNYNNNFLIKNLGIANFHFYDWTQKLAGAALNASKPTQADMDELNAFFSEKYDKESGLTVKYRGVAKGANLIVIQMESLQGFLVDAKVNGREVTPNFNKFVRDSLYFNNIYFQVAGGNTSDAEFAMNNSLYPMYTGAVYLIKPLNKYYALPAALDSQGYKTAAQHAFDPIFWNRRQMYGTLGFGTFYDKATFTMDEMAGWNDTALSDRSFYRQALDRAELGDKYYNFMISLTNHSPYLDFTDSDFDVGKYDGSFLGNFLKSANFADGCFEELITDLKAKGLYDSALIVVYGDHAAIPRIFSKELFDFTGLEDNEPNWIKLQKVPLLIKYPGLPTGTVDSRIGGDVDILPTIAGLMDIRSLLPYMVGKDLLNTDESYAVRRSGAVITDDFIFSANRGMIYSAKTGEPLHLADYKDEILKYTREVRVSDMIIAKNLLKEAEIK